MDVVGMASSGQEAIDLHAQCRPDVTLMDLRLGAMSGLDAIRAIRATDPLARVIVLTMYQGDEDIYRALSSGATTYLLKESLPSDLIRVIREVHAGGHPIDANVQARLAERASQPTLTPREVEIIKLVSDGKRNKEIGAVLGIAERTVAVHLNNIFEKLQVNERTAAVNTAVRRGIVHLD